MQSLLITPRDQAELDLLANLLARLNIATTVVEEEEEEDIRLGMLMAETNRSEQVSRERISKALKAK